MYAVIKTGGKQYKVAAGEKLKVEQIPADVGAEIVLDQVLLRRRGRRRQARRAARRWRDGQGHGRRARPRRQGAHLQDAPPQALSQAPGPSPELHRDRNRRHQPAKRARSIDIMAHKKAGGSSRNGRDSQSKRLGVKAYGGEADPRRQHHRAPARHAVHPGVNVGIGQGPHAVRAGRRQGRVHEQGRGKAQDRERRARRER